MKRTNKFINSAENAVDDSISGLIRAYDNLATLEVIPFAEISSLFLFLFSLSSIKFSILSSFYNLQNLGCG